MDNNKQEPEVRKELTFCRICESLCGLEVTFKGGKIESILPDENHVATRGFACPKGLKQHKMYDSPDRLLYPMKRTGKDWGRIGWDQANREIGEKVAQLRRDHGPLMGTQFSGWLAIFRGVLSTMRVRARWWPHVTTRFKSLI